MKTNRLTTLTVLVLAVAIFSWGLLPRSAGADSGPTDKVKQIMDAAMRIQTQPDLQGVERRPERMKQVRKLIADNFLSEEMGQQTLGDIWGSISAKQRAEFIGLFSVLFQDSYTRLVLNFLQQENVDYRKETMDGKIGRVETVILRPNEHIPVNYVLQQKNGKWLVADVEIDGQSIVEKYKRSFMAVINKSSFNDLLNKLKLQKRVLESGN